MHRQVEEDRRGADEQRHPVQEPHPQQPEVRADGHGAEGGGTDDVRGHHHRPAAEPVDRDAGEQRHDQEGRESRRVDQAELSG